MEKNLLSLLDSILLNDDTCLLKIIDKCEEPKYHYPWDVCVYMFILWMNVPWEDTHREPGTARWGAFHRFISLQGF
jgi:hypothetical protein